MAMAFSHEVGRPLFYLPRKDCHLLIFSGPEGLLIPNPQWKSILFRERLRDPCNGFFTFETMLKLPVSKLGAKRSSPPEKVQVGLH